MTYLTWLKDLAVGNHFTDDHHRTLIRMAKRLQVVMQEGRSQGVCMMKQLLAAAAFLGAAGALSAQTIVPSLDQPGRKGDMARLVQQKAKEKFDSADRDKDGKLSKDEASAAFPYMGEHFEKYDRNGDGFLTWEEYVGHDRWKKD